MSYTGIYTPLHPLDVPPSEFTKEPGAVTPGARVVDPEGLREHVPDWSTDMHTHERTEKDAYPGRTWEILEGFKTWEYDRFNIERLAIPGEEAVDFWAGLSEYTEPFQFFATTNGYPHALNIVTSRTETDVGYHVVCWHGEIWVHSVGAERAERELVE